MLYFLFVFVLITTSCSSGNQESTGSATASREHSPETLQSLTQQDSAGCTTFNCWNGIVPGSSTLTEAQSQLETLYSIDNVIINQDPNQIPNAISWEYRAEDSDTLDGGWVHVKEGIVSEMIVGFPKDQLVLSDVVALMGEPSFVYVARAISSDILCAAAFVTYPEIGVHAYLNPEEFFVGAAATQSISALTLLTPEEAAAWTITDHVIFEWQGYIDYCELWENNLQDS